MTESLTRDQLLEIDYFLRLMAKADSTTRGRELNIHFGNPNRDGFIGQISVLGDMSRRNDVTVLEVLR